MRYLSIISYVAQPLALAIVLGATSPVFAIGTTPNIVVIYADDLGYGDVSAYNPRRGKIPTPHIDRLAAEGMMFTDAHSSSGVCSPSRYTLLTGRYHWRTRLQSGIVGVWGKPLIAPDRLTIAGLLKKSGYQTACFGKWHLGWDWPMDPNERQPYFVGTKRAEAPSGGIEKARAAWRTAFSQPIDGGPISRGFDTYFGVDLPNFAPFCFIQDDRTVGIPSEWRYVPTEILNSPDFMLTEVQINHSGPQVAGWDLKPIQPTIIERTCQYVQERAEDDQPFFVYLALTSPHTPLALNEPWEGRSGLNRYGDFVMEMDAAVGDVLQAIVDSGEAESTLVVFTSDNGCAPYIKVQELEEMGHYPSGPLRGYKSDAWEGGHRVPFVVRWPGVVEPGSVCDHLVHQADLIATCAEIVGATIPDDAGEDSVSLLPLFEGADEPVRDHAVSQSMRGLIAVRQGSWKLIFGPGSGGWGKGSDDQPAQLYNLADDLGETNNLYAARPDKVEELTALMERLVNKGRSTPGPSKTNDQAFDWKKFMDSAASN